MTQLTFDEIERIGKWKPYRNDWPVDRNSPFEEDEQRNRYGRLIDSFNNNKTFESIQYQDGSMANFIEFICFKKNAFGHKLEAIDVFVNLCAPIAAYGQVGFFRLKGSHGLSHPAAKDLGAVKSKDLKEIEEEIKTILQDNDVEILATEFLDQDLLPGLTIVENLIEGKKLFNYLFQWTD